MGHWCEIKPTTKREHPWLFATLYETGTDGESRITFHFRNVDRTKFGSHVFVGEGPHYRKLRQMATRVVVDKAYRNTLLSDDPELPKLWKRR